MAINDQINKRIKELKEEFSVEQSIIAKEQQSIQEAQKNISQHTQNLISLQGEYKALKRLQGYDRPNTKKLKAKKK